MDLDGFRDALGPSELTHLNVNTEAFAAIHANIWELRPALRAQFFRNLTGCWRSGCGESYADPCKCPTGNS